MAATLLRLALIAVGVGLGQMGLDAFARGDSVAILQLALASVALVAGTAGFIVPILEGGSREDARHG